MKRATILLSLLGAIGLLSAKAVTLIWTDTNPPGTVNVFKVYSSTNITVPMTNWTVIATVPGTNTTVTLPLVPGVYFFSVTASNFWGESDFSDVASTPAPLTGGETNLKVQRNP